MHADETLINIRGMNQYVWVFTDGNYVIFKLRETREASIAHEFLAYYHGTLISDFYAGYDAVNCRQQKCWVHLIRDMNSDLWIAPFDAEFEAFVIAVRNLIIPIMEGVQVAPQLTVVRLACNANGGPDILLIGTLFSKASRRESAWTPQPHSAPIWRAPPEAKQAKATFASTRARTSASSARSATRRSAPRKARHSIACGPLRRRSAWW